MIFAEKALSISTLPIVVIMLSTASCYPAQSVEGIVEDADTHLPISGAIVTLSDSEAFRWSPMRTGRDGLFTLKLSGAERAELHVVAKDYGEVYLPVADLKAHFHVELKKGAQANVVGIGAAFVDSDGETKIDTVVPCGTAFAAGIRPGDILLAVDGEASDANYLEGTAKRVRGTEGSTVRLTIRGLDAGVREIVVSRRNTRVPCD